MASKQHLAEETEEHKWTEEVFAWRRLGLSY